MSSSAPAARFPQALVPACVLLLLAPAAGAARVTVPGTSVSIDLPAGFAPMPPEVISLKYSRGSNPPAQVYSTPGPSYAVNIAFALRDIALPAGDLAPARAALERSVQGTPGFRWVRRGVERRAGREWIVLQFWVSGLDAPIYNDLRVTRQGGKTLLVTANVTKSLYPRYAAQLTAAMNSLR